MENIQGMDSIQYYLCNNFPLNYLPSIVRNADGFSGMHVYKINHWPQKRTVGVVTETAGLIIPDYEYNSTNQKYYTRIVDVIYTFHKIIM